MWKATDLYRLYIYSTMSLRHHIINAGNVAAVET